MSDTIPAGAMRAAEAACKFIGDQHSYGFDEYAEQVAVLIAAESGLVEALAACHKMNELFAAVDAMNEQDVFNRAAIIKAFINNALARQKPDKQ